MGNFDSAGPGKVLGIIGGGQLARMLALAAADYGVRVHVFTPDNGSPALDVAAGHTIASYDSEEALASFARGIDVVTYEFENVPAKSASFLAERILLEPNAHALAVTQDRLVEKNFVSGLGLALAPYHGVLTLEDLKLGVAKIGLPSILKTRRFGYDGKGQVKISSGAEISSAYRAINGPATLERFVPFQREVSVVAARDSKGIFVAYDVCENEHRDHILALTRVPARIAQATAAAAVEATRRIALALHYVGVLAVEFFVVGDGDEERILVNEIAPRVHNSGHWTIEGAATSQFHQHVRAVCGFPLGSTTRRGAVEMENLIGDAALKWRGMLREEGAYLHLYGKQEARNGRKMGHVTRIR
jgi:5-(carboxyamino)imidazole ribonucleotide synthase